MRKLGFVALFYALAIVLVFYPFFFFGKTFFSTDLYLMSYKPFAANFQQFAPFNHFDDDILRFCYLYQSGAKQHIYQPYWISEIFGGIAPYANTYASHFSPLNWILRLGPLYVTYPLRLLSSLWIAGIAMFTLVTTLGISFVPALFSGMAYMFSSLFITMLLRYWIPGAYSWVPFMLTFAYLGFAAKKHWATPLCAVFLALSFLDGFFQSAVSVLFVLGTFLGYLGWQDKGWRGFLRATAFGLGVFTVAFGLSAMMWFPQLEYFAWDLAKGSSRAAGNDFQKTIFQRVLSIPFLVAAFFPQAIGSVRTLDLAKLIRSHLQDFSLFIGTIPLLLGISSWRSEERKKDWGALWAVALMGLLIPILTPLDRFFYFRFLSVYLVGMAALSALGLQIALAPDRRQSIRKVAQIGIWLWGIIAGMSLSLRAFLFLRPGWLESKARAFMEGRASQSTIGARNPSWMIARATKFIQFWSLGSWEFVIPLALTGVAVFLVWYWAKRRLSDRIFVSGAFAVTLIQLGLFVHSWIPFNSLQDYPLFPDNEIAQFMRVNDPGHRFRSTVNDVNGVKEKEAQIIPTNTNFFYGYSTLEGFDGLRPMTIQDLRGAIDDYKRLGELNVKYILTNPEPPLLSPSLVLRHKGIVAIYENLLAQPRAKIVYSYEIMPLKEIMSQIRAEGLPHSRVLLETRPQMQSRQEHIPSGTAQLIADEGNVVRYQVKSDKPGLFVATESYYPGWKAFWNGQQSSVLRANGVMRAVEISAGEGVLEFRFEPSSYKWGMVISVLSMLLVALWGLTFSRLA